jgi:thiol:disulfide interchange protein DsbD
MMKKNTLFLLIAAFFVTQESVAQMGSAKQVTLSHSSKKLADKRYEVSITANINGNFHLYAQDAGADGPIPTKFTYNSNPLLILEGKTKELGKKITKVEEVWGGKVNFYEKTVTFTQVVVAKSKAKTSLNGKIEFMVCNDEVCLPPAEVSFKIAIGG